MNKPLSIATNALLLGTSSLAILFYSGCALSSRTENSITNSTGPITDEFSNADTPAPKQPAPTQQPATPAPAAPTDGQVMMAQAEPPADESVEIFRVGNDGGAFDGGQPAAFTLDRDYYVTELWTYHANKEKGDPTGTNGITAADGTVYGPWPADKNNGIYWKSTPNITLKAGNYLVTDSDPGSWSQNAACGGQGMSWMLGIPQ